MSMKVTLYNITNLLSDIDIRFDNWTQETVIGRIVFAILLIICFVILLLLIAVPAIVIYLYYYFKR